MNKRFTILASIAAAGFALAGSFQACGRFQLGSEVMASGAALELSHPSADPVLAPSQKIMVGGKAYVAELMRDIFTPTKLPAAIGSYGLGGLSLAQGQSVSVAGFTLVMQTDGNAVMYDPNSTPVWYTSTYGQCTACLLVFQTDGNLVVYNTAHNPYVPLWDSHTGGTGKKLQLFAKAPFLAVTDTANTLLYPAAGSVASGLNALIEKWILFRPSQYGGSCNPYDTYATADCGGDVSNASLPSQTDDSSLRESYRLQFCSNLLADDDAVDAALEKIGQVDTAAPTAASIAQLYALFYRDDAISVDTLGTLTDLDAQLAGTGEPTLERWRALVLQLCDSPGWQLL